MKEIRDLSEECNKFERVYGMASYDQQRTVLRSICDFWQTELALLSRGTSRHQRLFREVLVIMLVFNVLTMVVLFQPRRDS